MSVEIIATSRRRPCPPYEQPVVEIRVGGRTFSSDCQTQQEAIEAAGRIKAEFKLHFEEDQRRLKDFGG